MGKAGIDFRIKEDDSFEIGTSKKGKIKGLYLPFKQKNEKTNFTLKEILEEIIEKARKQHSLEHWTPCPRNVGITISKRINNLYSKVEKENLNQAITKNKKYINEAKEIILSFNNKQFNEKQFREESTKRKIVDGRDELEAQNTNRMHIELFICKGLVKKIAQGTGENEYLEPEHKRVSNKYIQTNRNICPYLEKQGDGIYKCTCKNFKQTPRNETRKEGGFE